MSLVFRINLKVLIVTVDISTGERRVPRLVASLAYANGLTFSLFNRGFVAAVSSSRYTRGKKARSRSRPENSPFLAGRSRA